MVGANVLLKLIPGICEKPWATRQALKQMMMLLGPILTTKVHQQLMALWPEERYLRTQVPHLFRILISSSIASLHLSVYLLLIASM
jgi:hypothetical protein